MPELQFQELEHDSALYHEAVDLRRRLLRQPLGLEISEQELRAESDCRHFAMLDQGRVVATVMAVPREPGEMRIRQMVVTQQLQGRGVGRELLVRAEEVLRGEISKLVLHAREPAIGFYRKCGYREIGGIFMDLGIPHQGMEKRL